MKAFIQHESRGRLRVRMHQYRMSLEQADLLEAYLLDQPGVKVRRRPRAHLLRDCVLHRLPCGAAARHRPL